MSKGHGGGLLWVGGYIKRSQLCTRTDTRATPTDAVSTTAEPQQPPPSPPPTPSTLQPSSNTLHPPAPHTAALPTPPRRPADTAGLRGAVVHILNSLVGKQESKRGNEKLQERQGGFRAPWGGVSSLLCLCAFPFQGGLRPYL